MTRSNTRPIQRRLLAAAALALLSAPALAQPASLSRDIVTATQLDSSARASVDEYAAGWIQRLGSADAQERDQARRALLQPLKNAPTPAFRIQYGSQVKERLSRLVEGSETDRLFAAELSGRLATVDAHAATLELLGDDSPAVRYAAARAARLQLESIDNPPAALNDQHRSGLIDALSERITSETDAGALDGLLTAATEAVLRNSASTDTLLESLCAALTTNIQDGALDADTVPASRAMLRSVAAVQQRYRNTNSLVPDLARESGLLAGSAMGYVLETIENDPNAENEAAAAALEQLVKAAHNLAFFSATASNVRLIADEGISDAFTRWRDTGDTRPLRREIEKWIGPSGVLTRAPFSADPADFPGLS